MKKNLLTIEVETTDSHIQEKKNSHPLCHKHMEINLEAIIYLNIRDKENQ